MARNKVWLWRGYDKDELLIGMMEATGADHAMDEFEREYIDLPCVRVIRVRGSGSEKGLEPSLGLRYPRR